MVATPSRPKWQTVTLFFSGLGIIFFETGLNAMTGQQVNYSLIGAAVGMMVGGPVLNKSSSRKDQNGNDDADA